MVIQYDNFWSIYKLFIFLIINLIIFRYIPSPELFPPMVQIFEYSYKRLVTVLFHILH